VPPRHQSGKAIGRPKVGFDRAAVDALGKAGLPLRQVAPKLGVGATTVRCIFSAR